MGLVVALVAALLAADVPKPAPRIANGAWAGVLKEHPRLLGPRAFLQQLAKERAQAYEELKKTNDSVLAAGIVNAVDGIPRERAQKWIDAAMKAVADGVTNEHQDTWVRLTDAALAYDLLHDLLSDDERKQIVEWMNGHLATFTADEGAFHNSTLSKVLCYLRVAYATWGENPRAREFRDYAIAKLYEGKLVPVLVECGAGGGFTECGWYTRGSLWHLVQALELARRLEGYDGFQKAPAFFYQRLAYEMFQPYPGLWTYGAERDACEGDGSFVYGGHNEYPRHTRTVLAQYFRGSELARAVATRRRKGSNAEARLVDFLWEEEPDAPLDLASFPLSHLASGIGRIYARSDWTDDATWIRLECGDLFSHHQHLEVGNLELFRREPLATESGEYEDYGDNHSVNWLLRTVAHNCIVVHDPEETWTQLRDGGKNKYANDGGQTKSWDWVVDTLDAWKAKRAQFERGDIVAYDPQPTYLYVAEDCTKAYSPKKLSLWVRQVIFLRPATIVVFDRVVATRAEYAKTWLLHCQDEPKVAGATTTIANGKGSLVVETLLPEKAAIAKVEGYAYGGQTFDPPKGVLSETAPRWRIEVSPPAARAEDLFLHVFFTDGAQPAKLVRRGTAVGVDVGGVEVLFDGRVGASIAVGGKTVALKAGVKAGRFER